MSENSSTLETLQALVNDTAREENTEPEKNSFEASKSEPIKVEFDPDDIESTLEKLNIKHAVVVLEGKTAVLNEEFDPVQNRMSTTFSSISDFKHRYSNLTVFSGDPIKPKPVKVADIWLGSKDRRQYDGVVFDPSGNHPGYFNLYKGLAVTPKPGDWSLYRNLIFEVVASGDSQVEEYILGWLADAYQNPGGPRPGTAIALRGGQGSGKGTAVNYAGQPFGQHYLALSSSESLTGRFNHHLKDAILVFADEAVWGGDKTAEGKLKSMITEPTIFVESKGINGFHVKNCVRILLASNNDWVVPAGLDERRFAVVDVSEKKKGDHEYFGAIHDQMQNGGLEGMVYDLLNMDLSGINLRNIPRTDALLDQIENSLSPFGRFWFEKLRLGVFFTLTSPNIDMKDLFYHDCIVNKSDWPEVVSVIEFNEEVTEFCRRMFYKYPPSDKTVGKELKKLCPEIKRVRRRTSEDKERYEYQLPTLQRCRELFQEQVKMEINWDT